MAARAIRCPGRARLAIAEDPHRARQLARSGRGGRHGGDDCSGRARCRGGLFDLGVDALHVLTAGLWVGGLAVLVALGRSVEPRALHRFSTLAIASVLTLIGTGTLNSLRRLNAVEELWLTSYGLTLAAKLILVASTLTAAGVSRRRLHQKRVPLRSVRFEVALTVAVLAVTALLSTTAPPPRPAELTSHIGHDAGHEAADDSVQMSLGDQGNAALAVLPATTTGSQLHLSSPTPPASRYPLPESP